MAVKFLWKVGEALNDTGKASTEYRQAIQHLQGLLLTLQHLQSADFADTDANVVGTLQTLSASVEKPISVFIHDIKKFEESLGLGDTTNVLVASLRRVQWATRNVKKLEKLGAMIAAQMQAIHVLLGTTILQTQVKSAASGCHNYALLHATAVDHRTHTENLTHQILMARDDYSTTSSRIESNQTVNRELLLVAAHQRTIVADQLRDQISTVAAQIDDLRTCQRERDARLISTITQGAVYAPPEGCGASALCQLNETACVAARADQDLSQGLMQSLRMIALALGNLLRSLLLLAPHIWFALCTLPKLIPRSVSLLLDDCIHFEDVFGMERKLHYAWFQHYEVFEAFLLADFRGKPGEHRIRSKMYLITCHNTRHVNNELSVTSQKSWNENIRPQAKIRMSLAIVGSNVTSRTTFSHRRDVGITAYPDCQIGRISYRIALGTYTHSSNGTTTLEQDFRDPNLPPLSSSEITALRESREAFSEIDHFKRVYSTHEADSCFLCWKERLGLQTGFERFYNGRWADFEKVDRRGVHRVLYYRARGN